MDVYLNENHGWTRWLETHCDVNGNLIEIIHDYKTLELYNSYTVYTKGLENVPNAIYNK